MDEDIVQTSEKLLGYALVFTVFDRDALIYAMADQKYTKVKGDVGISRVDEWGDNFVVEPDGYVQQTETTIEYADQMPPFNITISFVNEYGKKAVMRIIGCEILNEGSGMSIDDITTDKACTFVARKIEYLKPLGPNADSGTGGLPTTS